MSDLTPNPVSLSFDPNDDRPLPERIAEGYGFPLAYHDLDDGKRYYAIHDWIRGVAQLSDVRKFWHNVKRRMRKADIGLFMSCQKLKYTASDGKNYSMDFADTETLLRLTQRMDAETGIRNLILDAMVQASILLDNIRIHQSEADIRAIQNWPQFIQEATVERKGWLYLLNAHNGQYKIGRASDLKARLRSYATLPFRLTLEHSVPCDDAREAESELHRRYASKRIKGEWFELSYEEIEEIKQIREL